MENTFLKTLPISVLSGLAITLVTFSQTPEASKTEIVAMTLPADNVTILDANGRSIVATVLSQDAQGIVIRMADGKEHQVAWDKLNAANVAAITGKPAAAPIVPAKPLSLQERAIANYIPKVNAGKLPGEKGESKYIARVRQAAVEANKEIKDLSAKELRDAYLAKDPKVMTAAATAELLWEQDESRFATYGDPGRVGYHTRPDDDYIRAMEIKDPDVEETVSLREEFKKLGVKPTAQVGNTCAVYSIYHLLQYAILKDGGKPPSGSQFYQAVLQGSPSTKSGGVSHHYSLRKIKTIYGKRAFVLHIDMGIKKLTEEVIKQELRYGRPCRAIVRYKKSWTVSHAITVIGFHTKDGVTRYEYLDSNLIPTEDGSGYMFMPNEYIADTIDWSEAGTQDMLSIHF